jgi:FAD/FMN-containing dehydrogenase
MMQDLILGLEVVLSDGKIWNGMRAVQKDNAGYQLRRLFCGSEGTLGVITKAIIKLSPRPNQKFTALLAVNDACGLIELSKKLRSDMGEFLTAMEFFSDIGLSIALNNIPELIFPLKNRTSYYLLIEVCSGSIQVPLESMLLEIAEWSMENNLVTDGSLASSEAQRISFWRLREEQPEGQKRLGAQLKHDISVPPGRLVEFLDEAVKICNTLLPGVIINAFGHLGDGNVHYNLSPPKGRKNFSNLDNIIYSKLGELATKMSGSFAAEHGIGRAKIMMADNLRDPIERDVMRKVKKSLDHLNQLNPGVLFLDK